MNPSDVYYTDLRTRPGVSLPDKLENLVRRAGIEKIDWHDKFAVIKIHFGELGNMAYIRPGYVDRLVRVIGSLGAKVYLSDANTLYKGSRSNAVDHIHTAAYNGFNAIQVDAPVIIADGVKGTDYVEMPVNGGVRCTSARIGRAIADADIVVSLTHFKGHGREAGVHVCDHGHDVFKLVHPDTDWPSGLAHGEKIGIGTRGYTLIKV